MASIFAKQKSRSGRKEHVATTASTYSEAEKKKALSKIYAGLKKFPEEQNVQDALSLSKQIGNFLYERRNGVPDKIAENKGNSIITNIIIGIAEGRPSGEIMGDVRRIIG